MQFDFKTILENASLDDLRRTWRVADESDVFRAGWLNDHLLPVLGNPSDPCLESWVTLSALSQVTTRLRLGILVSAMVYRHPAVLAKMACTLDILSNGRLELGLGAGWTTHEATAYGIDFPSWSERFGRLEEGCAVVTSLLTQDVTDFDGRYFTLVDARCEPKPIQRPRPPLVIGGTGPKQTLRIAARFADHWNHPIDSVSVTDWRRSLNELNEHCAAVGRDPASIVKSVQLGGDLSDPGTLVRRAAAWQAAGADIGILSVDAAADPRQLARAAQALSSLAT